MPDIIERLKKLPPMTQQVCGSCKFYQRDSTSPSWSSCHAVGGLKAHDVWPKCQGQMWQPKISIIKKVRQWLAAQQS
jgi:hypothetical protein